MFPGSLPFALPLLASTALAGGLALYAFRRAARPGALTFGLLMAAMAEWAAFYALELLAPGLPEKLLAAQLQYIGIAAMPPLWLAFALHFTGRAAWLTRARRLLLAAPGALTFALALTNEWHHLIWIGVGLDPAGAPAMSIAGHGTWFWAHTLISYAFILTGVALYALVFARAARPYRRQAAVMLLGALTPLAGNALFLAGLFPVRWLDPTPFFFAFSGLLLALGFFRFGLLEIMPIAAPLVIEHLQDAVIVADIFNRVVDLNPAARRLFGADEGAVGRNLLEVLWPTEAMRGYAEGSAFSAAEGQMELEIGEGEERRVFQLTVSPIRDHRVRAGSKPAPIAGRLLVLREITREHALLEAERRRAERQRRLTQAAGDLMAAPNSDAFWSTLMESARRMLAADRAAVYLYDRAADRLSCPYASGLSAEYVAAVNRHFRSIPGGRVLSRPEPVVVADAQTHPDTAPLREFILREGYHSYAVFSLLAPEGIFGAVVVYRDALRPFSEGEVATGQTLAHIVASALRNLRLLEAERRRARQMELLNEITHASLRVADFREMLQLLADRLGELFEADGAFITLWDEAQQQTIPAAAYGDLREPYPAFRPKPGETTLTEFVLRAGHALAVEDVFNTPYLSPRIAALFPTRSMLALPLIAGGRKLGAALIAFNQTHYFTPDEVALGEQAAGQIALAVAKARLLETEREQRQLAEALRQVGLALSESLDFETVLDRLLDEIGRVVPYDAANVMLVEGNRIRIARLRGYERFGESIARDISTLSFEIETTENLRQMAETGRPLIIPDTANYPGWVKVEASAHVCSWAGAPILARGQVIAFFSLDKIEPGFYRPEHAEILAAFAGQAALAIENARLFAETQALAVTDGLTGLANRRAFDRALEREAARAQRYGNSLALIILDIDSFKQYNDAYGHPAGDKRLRAIAELLRKNVRDLDVAARYGGEEFAIILPHTDREGAAAMAERLRAAAEQMAYNDGRVMSDPTHVTPYPSPIPGYTLSLGVAVFPEDAQTPEALLRAADDAELAAKRAGKNRVCIAGTGQGEFQTRPISLTV